MTFARTTLSVVSTDKDEYARKALQYKAKAEQLSVKSKSTSYKTASILDTRQQIKLTLLAAESFRISGQRYDSASSYAKTASLFVEALHDSHKGAELYTEAAATAEHVDSSFANQYYRKAVTNHCDSQEYDKAARLEERMGNSYTQNKDYELAIDTHKRASKLHAAANNLDSADRTVEREAYMLAKVGRLSDAAYTYQQLAISYSKQNLKKFNVPVIMLKASILLISECLGGKELAFSEVRDMMEEIYKLDCRFGESSEHQFLVDVIQCIVKSDLDQFADCLFWYNSIAEFDDITLLALETIKDTITERSKM